MTDRLEEMRRELEAERRINAAFSALFRAVISPERSINEIFQLILDQARSLTDSDHGFVSSIDPQTGAHISHTLTQMRAEGCSVPLTEGVLPRGPHKQYGSLWGYGLDTRKAFFTNSPATHPASRGLPQGHVPLRNFLSVPVLLHGRLLGQIALANARRGYSQPDIDNVTKLAAFYAGLLQNHLWAKALREAHDAMEQKVRELTLAEQKMRHSAEIQAVLREIAEAALLVSSLEELYRTVHRLIERVLPARLFHINLLDEETDEIVVPFNADTVTVIPARRPVAKGMTEYIMRLGHAAHITPADLDRLTEAGEYTLGTAQNVQSRHYLGAPLIDSRGKPFGSLALILAGDSESFQPEDVEVLSIIAAQVSMAIERKRMEEGLHRQAKLDSLTGVANRRHFLACAEEELKRLERYHGACSLLMLDLDHFKKVNDLYGHAAGDTVLAGVARICAESLRSSDLLGRIGGEEFCILLVETGVDEALQAAERLRGQIRDTEIPIGPQDVVRPQASIGVAEWRGGSELLTALMGRADEALYRAKQNGRNRSELAL